MTIMDFLLAETRRLYDLAGEPYKAEFEAHFAEYNRQHEAEMVECKKLKELIWRILVSGPDTKSPPLAS
jgi:hypothetical protein